MHAVICEDASRTHAPGTIIGGVNTVDTAKRKGCKVLPFDAELPRLANMGHVQVFFGEGWMFNRNAGERGCPAILHINNRCQYLYWAARVEPVDPDTPINGTLRMVHSSENSRGMGVGMRQIAYVKKMPTALDDKGGAVVFGKGGFSAGTEGLLFTELYAVGRFRVKWFAATQHYEDLRVDE